MVRESLLSDSAAHLNRNTDDIIAFNGLNDTVAVDTYPGRYVLQRAGVSAMYFQDIARL